MTLAEYLKVHDLKPAEFGVKVGVRNKQTLSRYIRAERMPSPDMMIRIQAETGGKVTPNDFAMQNLGRVRRGPDQAAAA